MPEQLSRFLFHTTKIPPLFLKSNSSELYPGYFCLPAFTDWLDLVFLFTSFWTQSVRLHLATYQTRCSTCITNESPCHTSCHQVLHKQFLLREAEDFPICDKHPKHVPLLTCLAWLEPVQSIILHWYLNMSKP